MNRKLKLGLLLFFGIITGFCYGQTSNQNQNLTQGEKLFKENKPKEAVQVLENELLNGICTANTYNFLGLGYYQLEEYSKSIDAFNRGIKAQPTNIKILSFNMGNTYYAMKDFVSAIECYSTAFRDDQTYYEALLNRANAFLMADQLGNAKSDYEDFILKNPDDKQKNQIERLIQALNDEILRREEEARLLAEQDKARWEVVDPSIDDNLADNGEQWEKVEDVLPSDNDYNSKTDWETVDASIKEDNSQKKQTSWEEIQGAKVENPKVAEKTEEKPDWEEIKNTQETNNGESQEQNKIILDKLREAVESGNVDWEKLDNDISAILKDYDSGDLKDSYDSSPLSWENLSEEERLEMKRLELESRLAHDKWLEEQSLLRQKEAEEQLSRLKAKDDEERLAREKLLEDMMRAEEARRKKLLDDVANSLQNSNSTNMSSGSDELIDYDTEGELD